MLCWFQRLGWCGGILILVGCREAVPVPAPQETVAAPAAAPVDRVPRIRPRAKDAALVAEKLLPIVLHDTAGERRLEFHHTNGANGRKLMVESISGGGGWLDYDRNGTPDYFAVQGGDPTAVPGDPQPRDQLFRNVEGHDFEDVTPQALPGEMQYGNGLAVGDFDEDGFPDVFVSNVGPDALYRNLGDGTFEEITAATGTGDPRWGASAAWGDLDGDLDLDLFVCNYLEYDPRHPIKCSDKKGNVGICHPGHVEPQPDACYRNNGDGTFTEVADAWGLQGPGSKSLGVVISDFNRDGLTDLVVANDTTANFYYAGQPDGTFREVGHLMGCAISGLGEYQANMGIAFGDYDRNGYFDLYITHFTKESNTLYRNLGPSGFQDVTREAGLHVPTLKFLAFGAVFADFNADGRMELLMANGHIDDQWEGDNEPLAMTQQLFTCQGKTWRELSGEAGPYFQKPYVARSISTADFDLDGDVDAAVVNQNAPLSLLENQSQQGARLKVRLIGHAANRSGVNAVVTVKQGAETWYGELPGGSSYCAAHEPCLFFGLGASTVPCDLVVQWPGGSRDELTAVATNQTITVREQKGIVDRQPFTGGKGQP